MNLPIQKWRFSKLTFREQALMIGSYCLVVLVLFNLVYQPKTHEAERLKSRLATIEMEVRTLSGTLEEYEQNVTALSIQGDGIESTPIVNPGRGEYRISSIIREIGGMASKEGVELISVRPSVQEETDGFLKLLIEIDTRSRFKNLLRYMERLENASEPIAVSDIKMETSLETSPILFSRLTAEIRLWRGL